MKNLGKVVGYCPRCSNPIGEEELNTHCLRCDTVLHLDRVKPYCFSIVHRQTKQFRFSGDAFSQELNKRHLRSTNG